MGKNLSSYYGCFNQDSCEIWSAFFDNMFRTIREKLFYYYYSILAYFVMTLDNILGDITFLR